MTFIKKLFFIEDFSLIRVLIIKENEPKEVSGDTAEVSYATSSSAAAASALH